MDNKDTIDMSLRTAFIYFLIGALWILLSDRVLGILIIDKATITFISMMKGWIFVVITSVIIRNLVYNYVRKIRLIDKDLVCSNLKLSLAGKELEQLKIHNELLLNDKVLLERYCQYDQVRLNKLEEFHHVIMDTANDIIWEETDGQMRFSDRFYEVTGYDREEFMQMNCWESLLHPLDRMNIPASQKEYVNHKTPYFCSEYRIRVKNGQYRWFMVKGKLLSDERGEVYRKAGVYTDITQLKEYEQKLHDFACFDQLTGLQNRVALNEELRCLIYKEPDVEFAVLVINIDNFKYVNDTMGYTIGDNLLIQVSERLNGLYGNEVNLFRIGGDEFVLLIRQVTKREEIERKAVHIIRAFKTQFEVMESEIFITASIGVCLYPKHGTDVDTLLKNAEIAVHKAKENGKNRIVFYNEPMNESITTRMLIEKYLWTALQNNEFELYYQPQLDIETNCITGFEALIRWNNARLGMVSPDKFISIAEETRQIIPIGAWVLKSACEFLMRLHQSGYEELNISVNISMLQLLQDDFVEMVVDTIEAAGLSSRQVELEITESILMESYQTIEEKLKVLRAKGIRMALDDFGKGYSSLSYLMQLPITTLKIDKTFIDTITGDGKNKSMADLIVNLGRSMNLDVVAEGVETKEQMDYLAIHQCNKIQGYYFSKPLPGNEIMDKLGEQWIYHNTIKNTVKERVGVGYYVN